jgi:hypothetical protein
MDIEIITKHDSTRSEQWQHTLIIKIRGEQVELPIEDAKNLPDEINRALGNPANSNTANCAIFDVRLSLPDKDNYHYLKGFADACGVNWELADKDDYPDGLNSYDEVIDRIYELKGNEV